MATSFSEAYDPIRALDTGVRALKAEPGAVGLGGLLLFMLRGCSSGGGNFQMPQGDGSGGGPFGGGDPFGGGSPFEGMDGLALGVVLAVVLVGLCIGLVVFVIQSFLEPGVFRVGERMTIDGMSGIDTLFSGKDAWLSMMAYKLLTGFITLGIFAIFGAPGAAVAMLGFVFKDGSEPNLPLVVMGVVLALLLALPALIYVSLGLSLGPVALSVDRLSAMEALERSWTLVRGNRLQLFWFNLVQALVGLVAMVVGVLACCVGILVTGPAATGVVACAQTNAYLMLTRHDAERFALR